MEPCIEITHLQKRFGNIHAVNDLSLQVQTGQLFAFLGINGAGKSTTISMLCGQLRQDAGEIRIHGKMSGKSVTLSGEIWALSFKIRHWTDSSQYRTICGIAPPSTALPAGSFRNAYWNWTSRTAHTA